MDSDRIVFGMRYNVIMIVFEVVFICGVDEFGFWNDVYGD